MQRNAIETLLGAFVILVAVGFVFFFQKKTDLAPREYYELSARFAQIDGLVRGAPVRISGVDIGKVVDFRLDPQSYSAIVTLHVRNGLELPYDTAAIIASESLLGGKYLSLEPGADAEMLPPGGMIEYTQSTLGIEALLGRAIYSFSNDKDKKDKADPSLKDVEPAAMPQE